MKRNSNYQKMHGAQTMQKKDYLLLRDVTNEILEMHTILSNINRMHLDSEHCKYYGYCKSYNLLINGTFIEVQQMVQEFNGRCRYSIVYHQDRKYINHNIRYIYRLRDFALRNIKGRNFKGVA